MKNLFLFILAVVLISCETKIIEVPVMGRMLLNVAPMYGNGPNKGSKFYIFDDNVDIVKKLLKSWNNMDPEGMFEVLL